MAKQGICMLIDIRHAEKQVQVKNPANPQICGKCST